MRKTISWIGLGILTIFIAVLTTGNKIDSSETNPADENTKVLILKEKAAFNIGAAVKLELLKEAEYAVTLKKHFSQITAEYEMKMDNIWLSSISYNWTAVDDLVDFASQNEMSVHGHTLLWYRSFPLWFKNANYDSATFENKVKDYITTVVSRYRGKIISWDVANEIFDDFGGLRKDETVYVTFKDPIAFYGRCFQYARNADPNAKLFYNDYSVVISEPKRNAILQMVTRFKNEGFPIDGIGDQFHYKVSTDLGTMKTGLNDMVSTGLLIHISELDIVVNVDKSDTYDFTSSEKQKQADIYKAIAEMYVEIPEKQKFAITTWGITDKYTWLTGWWHPKEYPLLFDNEYNQKQAYEGFLKGLK